MYNQGTHLHHWRRLRQQEPALNMAPYSVQLIGSTSAYVCGFSFHVHLPCCAGSALQDTGLISPGNRSSSVRDECGDPRFSAVYHDQSSVGLPHSEQPGKRILSYSQRYKFAVPYTLAHHRIR